MWKRGIAGNWMTQIPLPKDYVGYIIHLMAMLKNVPIGISINRCLTHGLKAANDEIQMSVWNVLNRLKNEKDIVGDNFCESILLASKQDTVKVRCTEETLNVHAHQ